MNIRFLETFVWVANLGSFSAAASKLHVTQAAVSGRISALEKNLDQKLFERGARDIRLTPAGQTLLRFAKQMLDQERDLKHALRQSTFPQESIRIGVIESIVHTWFALFIRRLHQEHPSLEIELTVESSRRLHDLLKRGQIDLALQTDPVLDEGLRNIPLGALEMNWIGLQSNHPYAPMSLEELCERWPSLTFARHSQRHLTLLRVLEIKGVDDARIHFVSSIAASEQLIQEGLAVGALPEAACIKENSQRLLTIVPCVARLPRLQLVASWRVNPLHSLSEIVIDTALKEMHSYAQQNSTAIAPSAQGIFKT